MAENSTPSKAFNESLTCRNCLKRKRQLPQNSDIVQLAVCEHLFRLCNSCASEVQDGATPPSRCPECWEAVRVSYNVSMQ